MVICGVSYISSLFNKVQEQVSTETREDAVSESGKISTIVDPDITHWQTAKREGFFSIRFPKEWYWRTTDASSGYWTSVVTNDPRFDISKYPDVGFMGIEESSLVIENDSTIVMSFYGTPTVQIDDPAESTTDIVKELFVGSSKREQELHHDAICMSQITERTPSVLMCSHTQGNQSFQMFFIVNRKETILLMVQKRSTNTIPNEIINEIANSVRLLQ